GGAQVDAGFGHGFPRTGDPYARDHGHACLRDADGRGGARSRGVRAHDQPPTDGQGHHAPLGVPRAHPQPLGAMTSQPHASLPRSSETTKNRWNAETLDGRSRFATRPLSSVPSSSTSRALAYQRPRTVSITTEVSASGSKGSRSVCDSTSR